MSERSRKYESRRHLAEDLSLSAARSGSGWQSGRMVRLVPQNVQQQQQIAAVFGKGFESSKGSSLLFRFMVVHLSPTCRHPAPLPMRGLSKFGCPELEGAGCCRNTRKDFDQMQRSRCRSTRQPTNNKSFAQVPFLLLVEHFTVQVPS